MKVIDNENCYVAFLDILGFKDIIRKKEPDDIKKIFEKLINLRDFFSEIGERRTEFEEVSKNTYIKIMSDSIIIATPVDENNSLEFVCRCCRYIQFKLIEHEVIVRGGISVGMFFGNTEISFGDGLVRAYELENSVAVNPRVIIQPSVLNEYTKNSINENYKQILLFSNDNYYYLNYVDICIKHNNEKIVSLLLDNLNEFELKPRIREKYLYLKNEYNKEIEKKIDSSGKIKKEDFIEINKL